MTETDFKLLAPMIIIAVTPVILMLIVAVKRNMSLIYYGSIAGFILALAALSFSRPFIPSYASVLFIFDGLTLLFSAIIIIAGLLITLISHHYISYQESEKEEFYIIFFVAVLGALMLVGAADFVSLFLGLETLSLSLFILVSYRRSRHNAMEAGVKYLVLASVSSAFLLFGMGLIYLITGSFRFSDMSSQIASGAPDIIMLTGFGMMLVGIGFKLALVPFHMWTPDIYEGAPLPAATFVATISKGAVLVLIIRFFHAIKGTDNSNLVLVITVIAVLSMFIGNLLAIRQENVKRILAYSSIANMGYLLMTLLLSEGAASEVAVFYVVTYILTLIGAFSVITLLSSKENDYDMLENFRGLFWNRPLPAMAMTICMLSLAGIPLTAGFMAKFYLVMQGVDARLYVLVVSLIVSSVIGLYYYLRIITSMFTKPGRDETEQKFSVFSNIFLVIITSAILWLGIFPQGVLEVILRIVNA